MISVITGAVTVHRWFGSIDLLMTALTFAMTVSGVVASYLRSISWMYVVLLVQGVVETIMHTGTVTISIRERQSKHHSPHLLLGNL